MSVDAARAGLRLRGAHATVYKPRTHARRTQQNESGRERERARERARERERGRVEEQEKRTGMPRTPVRVRACTHTLGVRAPPAPPARTCGARRQRLPAVPPAPAASSHQHERAPSICGIAHASHARSLPPALGASGRSPFAPRCGLQPGSAGGQQTPSCRCRSEAATASAISPRARGRRRTHQQRQPPGQEPPSFLSSFTTNKFLFTTTWQFVVKVLFFSRVLQKKSKQYRLERAVCRRLDGIAAGGRKGRALYEAPRVAPVRGRARLGSPRPAAHGRGDVPTERKRGSARDQARLRQ